MDTVTAIFTQLGADSSVLNQFVVVVALFVLTKFLFLNKLQSVIETREEKTVKLEGSAGNMLEKVEELESKYKEKINTAHEKAQVFLSKEKETLIKEQSALIKKIENEVLGDIEKAHKANEAEVKSQREALLKEVDTLSETLVGKITQ